MSVPDNGTEIPNFNILSASGELCLFESNSPLLHWLPSLSVEGRQCFNASLAMKIENRYYKNSYAT